jgi:hypothetical protein
MNTHSRREFIRIASMAAGAFALQRCSGNGKDPTGKYSASLPTLGGAPDTADGHAIAAFVDTIVPGQHRDPRGTPGGIDVGAPGLFFDPELPALAVVPLLAALLDDATRTAFAGRTFAQVDTASREAVVDQLLAKVEVTQLAVQLAKLAYFSSAGAARSLGYPGANAGYINDPDFSFRKAMAREITGDGNYP